MQALRENNCLFLPICALDLKQLVILTISVIFFQISLKKHYTSHSNHTVEESVLSNVPHYIIEFARRNNNITPDMTLTAIEAFLLYWTWWYTIIHYKQFAKVLYVPLMVLLKNQYVNVDFQKLSNFLLWRPFIKKCQKATLKIIEVLCAGAKVLKTIVHEALLSACKGYHFCTSTRFCPQAIGFD